MVYPIYDIDTIGYDKALKYLKIVLNVFKPIIAYLNINTDIINSTEIK